MPRALHMQELHIADAARAAYLITVEARRAQAVAVRAHFWVFEHATESGRFIEFTEAASAGDLATLVGSDGARDSWRELQGA